MKKDVDWLGILLMAGGAALSILNGLHNSNKVKKGVESATIKYLALKDQLAAKDSQDSSDEETE